VEGLDLNMAFCETALILGGSRWQLGIIQAAKLLGLRVVVADISADAPGKGIADEFVQIDTNDREGLAEVVRRRRAGLVLAEQTDRLVPVAGYLNDKLGLPGIDEATAVRFTNKRAMRDALQDADVPMPKYRSVSSRAGAVEAVRWTGLPAIVKPLRAQSSIGVTLATSLEEAGAAYETAHELGKSDEVLVEEFVDGLEVTVEGISIDGTCTILAMSEKAHYAHRPCVARLLAYPPRLPEETLRRLEQTAKRIVEHLGLQNGLSHAEYRVRGGKPYLVEVAARGGGNGIASVIVPHISGIDTYALIIRRLLGERVVLPAVSMRAAILEFFDFAPGTVAGIEGKQTCIEQRLAQVLDLSYQPGDVIHAATDDRNRPGFFITLGDTRDQVDSNAAAIKSLIKVRYTGGSPS
jgi:biotin carboxylase